MPDIDAATPQRQQKEGLPVLEVRINQIDYVLAPTGQLDNCSLPRVPVIRIFGTSSTGRTACVHVHQIYPYVYVEYPGKLGPRHGKLFHILICERFHHCIVQYKNSSPDFLDL